MANLRDVRLRIHAVKQTLQVTRAMNLISTAKLRKGKRFLEDVLPFFTRIQKSIYDIVAGAGTVQSEFLNRQVEDETFRSAVVVITSDKGLAGGFNANVVRQAKELCTHLKNPMLVLVGALGPRYFANSPYTILENFSFKSRMPDLDDAKEIADYLISQYLWGVFDELHIVYTRMFNTLKLLPTEEQILPLNAEKMQENIAHIGAEKRVELQFEYLPSVEAVFDTLVPFYVKGLVYGSLVESYVSEQSARTSAMDQASKNAQDMLNDLQVYYNRARQTGITQEVSEIISGAAALID
jgi:F-type H+-transporting ATPase subunit gamma